MIRRRALALACGAWAAAALAHQPQRSAAELMDALMWNREPVGGPFTLVDQHGKRRTDRDFRGKFMLVYFGFTSCADVCPTDLQQIGVALEKLGPAAAAIQPLFITLDPERDTPSRLAGYVSAFEPRLVALTGSGSAIRQVADAYRVYFRKVPVPPRDYTIDHASFIFLMDRAGRYVGFFPPGTTADRMLEIIRPQLRER
jgi:cytochrome oxidase Cu insertion factor (SCO1/SenC/PrrC family)